jgi:predicted RNA-binding protein with PIN domain
VAAAPVVLVDAENVRRSRWPNLGRAELVERCRAWSEQEGAPVVVVFDGRDHEGDVGERRLDDSAVVVGTGGESADDWLARRAAELRAAGAPYWLVTSDRELRSRAGGGAERTLGGGAFVGQLGG